MTTYKFKHLFKTSISFVLIIILLSSNIYAADSDDVNYDYALKLKELGVFVGTGSGFELSRVPTRIEGIVMLVRLLGKESQALGMANNTSAFTDVPSWARGYVNYAKSKGLTNGVSATEFGSNDPMNANMYVTFLLRSLGYDDTKGDFNWKESLSKAKSIGMISTTSPYSSATFIRSHIAKLSYDALLTLYKNSPTTLAQYLVNIGALNESTALAIQVIDNPAVVNGKLYALKDTDFYDIGENDNYVDVVASASINNAKKNDVYIHAGDAGEASKSLLNIPVAGYSRMVFRIIQENSTEDNTVHIITSKVTKLSSLSSATLSKSYKITDASQYVSIALSDLNTEDITIYIETYGAGKIYLYNLYLE